jgi:hypothetical protein
MDMLWIYELKAQSGWALGVDLMMLSCAGAWA